MRIRCMIFGCREESNIGCVRCGALNNWYGDGDREEWVGLIPWLRWRAREIRSRVADWFRVGRCEICGRKRVIPREYSPCCSRECFEN